MKAGAQIKFPVATTANNELCTGGAFDGTNYLVSIVEESSNGASVTARIFSQDGNPLTDKIVVASSTTDYFTPVAFDGTNYLVIWQNQDLLLGRFISKTGTLIGSQFQIASGVESIGHIGFGGGKYLFTYNKRESIYSHCYVFGKIITPNGTVGSEFQISSGYGKDHGGLGNLAFDGTNFLVFYTEDENDLAIIGRFVSPAGSVGREIVINSSESHSDNPCAVAFDGINYLIVWPDEIGGYGSHQWSFFGQFIDKSGNKIGTVISINGSAIYGAIAPSIVFDGTKYLVTWSGAPGGTNWDISGRFVGKDGSFIGPEFVIDNSEGDQVGGALMSFPNGTYFVIVNNVVLSYNEEEETLEISGGDVYGMIKTIVPEVKGDINNDGVVDITDVIKVLRKAIGLE